MSNGNLEVGFYCVGGAADDIAFRVGTVRPPYESAT